MDAIDAHILVWGLRKQQPPEPERATYPDRCAKLIKTLSSPVMIPSVALGEYLIGCDPDDRNSQLAEIEKNYYIPPFDTKAAAIAAELWDKNVIDEIREQAKIGKQAIKADIQILATAIAQGAASLYVDDKHFAKFSQHSVIIKPIPTLEELNPPTLPHVAKPLPSAVERPDNDRPLFDAPDGDPQDD